MSTVAGSVRHKLLTPHPAEVTFAKRGFHAKDRHTREQLEYVGTQFLAGFKYATLSRNVDEASNHLEMVERDYRGFAYEGAAMAFALLDSIAPFRRGRVRAFLAGPAAQHLYMVHVGTGWAMARLPGPLSRSVRPPDPLLRWLALDGYGFHAAYFRTRRVVGEQRRPPVPGGWRVPAGQAAKVIDQGIGRGLWFVCGGDVDRLATVVDGFEADRRPDLWAGTGLAATYAGGADADALARLRAAAGACHPHLAQGAAFAAKARLLPGLVTPHTIAAVAMLCRTSVEEAAARTDAARGGLPNEPSAYLIWRRRVREGF